MLLFNSILPLIIKVCEIFTPGVGEFFLSSPIIRKLGRGSEGLSEVQQSLCLNAGFVSFVSPKVIYQQNYQPVC